MLDSHGQRSLKPRGSARSLRPWMRLTKVGVQRGVSLHKERYRANETQTTELEVRKQLKNNGTRGSERTTEIRSLEL